jgi:sec-independent protein translocase protein TatA
MGLDNPVHLALLVVILLLVFGAKRIPEIGRSLGGGLREFKQSINGEGSGQSHEPKQPTQQQQTLPAAAVQAPASPPVQQQPAAASTQPSAQDAFAQRDPASTDQR